MSKFESNICPRCSGSGQFSFNLKHGSMCYRCYGSGFKLKKHGLGLVAFKFFHDSLTIPALDLVVGMKIEESDFSKKFLLVQNIHHGTDKELGKLFNITYSVGLAGDKQIVLVDTGNSMIKFYPEHRVKIFHTEKQKEEKLKLALEYQSSLNVNGTKRIKKKIKVN